MKKTEKRGVGRPTAQPRESEKSTLGIRVRPALKRALLAAVEDNDATLTEECTRRLQLTVDYEVVFGNQQLLAMAARVIGAFRHAGRATAAVMRPELLEDEAWLHDGGCYDQAMHSANVELASARPGGFDATDAARLAALMELHLTARLKYGSIAAGERA
jgi:hypothetical protein